MAIYFGFVDVDIRDIKIMHTLILLPLIYYTIQHELFVLKSVKHDSLKVLKRILLYTGYCVILNPIRFTTYKATKQLFMYKPMKLKCT